MRRAWSRTRFYVAFAVAVAAVGASFGMAGCAGEAKRPTVSPAATVIGKPQSCIPLRQLRETRVRDDWTIDFIADGRVWRTTLTSRCSGLKVNDAFSYETSLSELCSTDIIYVLEKAGDVHRGAACGLEPFVPVKIEK